MVCMRFLIVCHCLNYVLVKLIKSRYFLKVLTLLLQGLSESTLKKISVIGEYLGRKCLEVNTVIFTSDSERR